MYKNPRMASRETKIDPLLSYPCNAFLMLRLEFVLILRDDLQAKLLRIIEAHIEMQRAVLYREAVNNQKSDSDQSVDIPKDIYVPISYKLFMNDLYDLVTSENTIKRALNILVDYKIIFRKYDRKKKYAPPEYSIHTEVLQRLLNGLKISGYQYLIPSILQALRVSELDTLKSSGYQILTPSGYQILTPSNDDLSTEEKSRVSNFDTNIRKIEDYVSKNESDPLSSTPSLSSLSDDLLVAELQRRELERLSTAQQELPTNVEKPSKQRNTEPLLIDEEKRIQSYWCQLGFTERPSAKKHWLTLSKHIQSFEQFKSLFKYTEEEILKDASFDNKTVSPGNLANAKYLDGWTQKQRRAEQPSQPTKQKPKITKEYLASLPL